MPGFYSLRVTASGFKTFINDGVFNGIWELPVGKGKRWLHEAGAATHILGGWQVTAIGVAQTGLFFAPSFSGSDPSNTNTFFGRPDCVRDPNLPEDQRNITRWFDPTALAILPKRPLWELWRWDPGRPASFSMGVHKNIALAEGKTFRFETTFSNFFNHPNFQNPVADITSGAVGMIFGTNGISDQSGARTVRFGLRIDF